MQSKLLTRCAVALETLKIYDEIDIVAQVRRVGPRLQAGIRSFADHPLIGEARGIGLIGAVEMVRDKTTKQSFEPKAGGVRALLPNVDEHRPVHDLASLEALAVALRGI